MADATQRLLRAGDETNSVATHPNLLCANLETVFEHMCD
jgi:hypothetical protein